LALLCLAGLLFYSYVQLYEIPFTGFEFLDSGGILQVYVSQPGGNNLLPKDCLLEFNGQAWKDYLRNAPGNALTTHQAGDHLWVTVQRGDQILHLDWIFPGRNRLEFQERIANSGWLLLAYLFWLAGALTLASLRPYNLQRSLLAALNFSLAGWIITGSISAWDIWASKDVFHLINWLLVPLAWHLNWNFPRPLKELPRWTWPAIYSLAGASAAIDHFGIFSFNLFPIPLFLASLGTIIILLAHLKAQPTNRRQVMILLTGFSVAILPGLARILFPIERFASLDILNYLAASALILVPVSFFYALTYRQLGAPELRASSALTVITYGVCIFLFNYLAIYWFSDRLQVLVTPTPMVVVISIVNCLVTIWFYPSYRRFIEHKFLGIPLPPYHLLTTASGRLLTAQDEAELRRLLRDDICSSLLIRQAALLKIRPPSHPGPRIEPLFTLNLTPGQLPQAADLAHLTLTSKKALCSNLLSPSPNMSWLRLCLTKQVGPDFQILALLGQRDPDDYYAPTEIPVLQTLIDSAAMALVNLEQKEKLHFLYQNDINRRESEFNRLANDLHDDVLNELAALAQSVDDSHSSEFFDQAYQLAVQRVREIISGLHPPLLNYGLGAALNGLVDDLDQQVRDDLSINIAIPYSQARYPLEVELHLFRIVQQACHNAVKHSQGSKIVISGVLTPDRVELAVEDDGVGMDHQGLLNLNWLLANKHFGLAAMHERAQFIGAELEIHTQPSQGTRVRLDWHPSPVLNPPLQETIRAFSS
jgi:signal transduction histidine kinase